MIAVRQELNVYFEFYLRNVTGGPLDGATPFGVSLNGDFKPVDTSRVVLTCSLVTAFRCLFNDGEPGDWGPDASCS